MTVATVAETGSRQLVWPEIPAGMNAIQIIAIARIVERVCGTAAAASYLAEAVVAFDKKTAARYPGTSILYDDPSNGPTPT